MIGTYWTTGIQVAFDGEQWLAWCDFHDNGFCENDSTQGTLVLRYRVADIARGVRILKADTERLGIHFNHSTLPPILYACCRRGEEEMPLPSHWRETLQPIADEIGFRLCENG